jgi:tRNA (guanine37-N1)-methyltransferase
MIMKVEPLVESVEAIVQKDLPPDRREIVLLSPRGELLEQRTLRRLAELEQLILVAGRYEGVDERFLSLTGARELSIGDYVLSGGEIPAMALVDAVTRLLPGAISDPGSAEEDSFSRGLLDYPHYTRPIEFRNQKVPEVLLSGNHGAIRRWRKQRSLRDTMARRPDLMATAEMDNEERALLEELEVAEMR